MLTKVPFHPMAKSFSLLEAITRLLFSLVQMLRVVFYYTSCQPNWSLLLYFAFGVQTRVDVMVIPLLNWIDSRENSSQITLDSIGIEPTINCAMISKLSLLFGMPSLVFFVMSCILRFYMIVVRATNAHQEALAKPLQIIGFSITGVFVALLWFGFAFQFQQPFTLACEVPCMKKPPRSSGFFILQLTWIVTLIGPIILYSTVIHKINKSTTAFSSDSQHLKPAISTFCQASGFIFIALSFIMNMSFDSTNMTQVST